MVKQLSIKSEVSDTDLAGDIKQNGYIANHVDFMANLSSQNSNSWCDTPSAVSNDDL
jgi:hypothetical protein